MGMTLAVLSGCAAREGAPEYGPVTTSFLSDDLLQVSAEVGRQSPEDLLKGYTECAAAEAMVLRGTPFARHVRTLTEVEGGIRRADAIYTVSTERPEGGNVLEAEVLMAVCEAAGIPGV